MTATAKIDGTAYAALLAESLPVVIDDEDDYRRMREAISHLIDKLERTREESALLRLLALVVEHYEAARFPTDRVEPHEVLQELMEARGLRQADLVAIFGSDGYTSDVVTGKRNISKTKAQALAELFHVAPALFLYGIGEKKP